MSSQSRLEAVWSKYVGPDHAVQFASAARALALGVMLTWVVFVPVFVIVLIYRDAPITYVCLRVWLVGSLTLAGRGLFKSYKCPRELQRDLARVGWVTDSFAPVGGLDKFVRWEDRSGVTLERILRAALVRFGDTTKVSRG